MFRVIPSVDYLETLVHVQTTQYAGASAAPRRLNAAGEAFAPQPYLDAHLKMAGHVDTVSARYHRLYYTHDEFVRRLTVIDARLDSIDRHGVDLQVLGISGAGPQVFDVGLGAELAQLANEQLAALVARHPGRFAGLATVDTQSPSRAAHEIERAVRQLNLIGVILHSHTNGEFLDDPRYWPILEAAVGCNAPVCLQPGAPSDAMIGPYSQHGMMRVLWEVQAECSLHVACLIMSGVFDRFPTLRIVLGHLGEGQPFWLSRLDIRYQNILRRGGLGALGMRRPSRLRSEYFKTNFYVTSAGMHASAPFDYCVKLLGPQRVLFAIGAPYEPTGAAVRFVRSVQPCAVTTRAICSGNAVQLFELCAPVTINQLDLV